MRWCKATKHFERTEFSMKRLLISGFVAVALTAPASVNKLPIEEFEDMSFVFSTPPKH
jgi:hypothetical protein